MEPPKVTSMEIMEFLLTLKSRKITIVHIYRSESSPQHRYTMQTFFREFNELMAHYNLSKNELIIGGDFNIHVNKPADTNTKKLNSILNTFGLIQHITEPTHEHGNTLDLLITRKKTLLNKYIIGEQLSDHKNILLELNLKKPPPLKKTIKFRKTKSINTTDFKKDVLSLIDHFNTTGNRNRDELNKLVQKYNSVSKILEKHAPLIERTVIVREPTPWSLDDIKVDKRRRRQLEKKKDKSNLYIDKQLYKEQKNKFNNLLKKLTNDDLSNMIDKNAGDSKVLFKSFNKRMNRKQVAPLPMGNSDSEVADIFNKFFIEKIDKIRNKLDERCKIPPVETKLFSGTPMSIFEPLTQDEVKSLILKAKNKQNPIVDPIPTWLVKECINELLPLITEIINASLELGIMPDDLKHAVIKPLLKKLGLELEKKNYRPVSNLPFISKLIEAAIAEQFTKHLKRNNINDDKQSAYKQHHSTETLLLKVQNDILMKIDQGEVVMLVLLDLSAAFDTIDHNILLNRLEKRYGITGIALKWFRSYLIDRKFSITIDGITYPLYTLMFGVPQGSVLGPILYTMYTQSLSDVIKQHMMLYHKYADDTQLYNSSTPDKIIVHFKY